MDKQPEIPARDSRVDRTPLAAYFSMEIALESLILTYAGGPWRAGGGHDSLRHGY
jgi:hypothetical protein